MVYPSIKLKIYILEEIKMAITAAMVKELREMTGAGMMDCKKALVEAVKNSGGIVVGALTAIELTELPGREALKDIKVMSVIKY